MNIKLQYRSPPTAHSPIHPASAKPRPICLPSIHHPFFTDVDLDSEVASSESVSPTLSHSPLPTPSSNRLNYNPASTHPPPLVPNTSLPSPPVIPHSLIPHPPVQDVDLDPEDGGSDQLLSVPPFRLSPCSGTVPGYGRVQLNSVFAPLQAQVGGQIGGKCVVGRCY